MKEEILNLVKGYGDGFEQALGEALSYALRNHPAIERATRITEICEEVNGLNEQVKNLLIEARILMEDDVNEPNDQDLENIKVHGDVDDIEDDITEGKMMGSKVFNFDPESIGLQDTNDNVEKMVVKDMKVLDGSEAPSTIPLFQDGPEWLQEPIATGKPSAGDTDITSGAKLDNQTIGKTKSSDSELDREARTGFDSTFNNVTKVKVMKDFTADRDIKDWDPEDDEFSDAINQEV